MTKTTNADPILLHEVYAIELRIHAVMLIFLGYRRLVSNSFRTAEEDDITGELVRNMKLAAQDLSSPEWVAHYEIREQIPQNTLGTLGKHRPKIDIEIERHHRGPRPCMGFEAKRLGRGNSISNYLGNDGLGRFIRGHYQTTHGEAGMIGYLQERSIEDWSSDLSDKLKPGASNLAAGGELRTYQIDSTLPSFQSSHIDAQGKSLFMIHLFLAFT